MVWGQFSVKAGQLCPTLHSAIERGRSNTSSRIRREQTTEKPGQTVSRLFFGGAHSARNVTVFQKTAEGS
jgi:hypothetical protein